MQSRPILSIAIPTWNRAHYLQLNVLALIEQIQLLQLQTQVEIVVSDNASDDSTKILCHSFAEKYEFFSYHRQATNVGANANFQAVISLARAEYVWLLGDDDLLAPRILTKVIQDLQDYSPEVAIGAAMYDDTQQKATHLNIHHLQITDQSILYHADVIGLAGKISGLIFKKEIILPVMQVMEPIIKQTRTAWPHLVWLIYLLNNPTKKLLLLPYSINQLISQHWHNLLFDGNTLIKIHFMDYQQLLLALQPHLNAALYQALLKHSIAHKQASLLKCVLYATYLNSYWESWRVAVSFYPKIIGAKNKLYYFIFLLIPLMVPVWIRKSVLSAIGFISKHRWMKLHKTITRIKQTKLILSTRAQSLRQQYNAEQL